MKTPDLSPDETERALVSLLRRFTPQPVPADASYEETHPSEQETLVLSALYERAKVVPGDDSEVARTKMLALIIKELSQAVLVGDRVEAVRSRLGDRGELGTQLYHVQFGDDFAPKERRGIKKSHVEEAVRRPDAVQHLTDVHFTRHNLNLSLYAKTHGEIGDKNRFSLLVQAHRVGDTQFVGEAWRVYHDDVAVEKADSLLDVLKEFADTYGVPISILGTAPRKFYLYEIFPASAEEAPLFTTGKDAKTIESSLLVRKSELGVFEIAIAYAINGDRYYADLRRHGVPVKDVLGKSVPTIMIRCPVRGVPVSTGFAATREAFETSAFSGNSFRCSACGQNHTWSKGDAFLSG